MDLMRFPISAILIESFNDRPASFHLGLPQRRTRAVCWPRRVHQTLLSFPIVPLIQGGSFHIIRRLPVVSCSRHAVAENNSPLLTIIVNKGALNMPSRCICLYVDTAVSVHGCKACTGWDNKICTVHFALILESTLVSNFLLKYKSLLH